MRKFILLLFLVGGISMTSNAQTPTDPPEKKEKKEPKEACFPKRDKEAKVRVCVGGGKLIKVEF